LRHAADLVDATHTYIVLLPGNHTGGAIFDSKTATIAGGGAVLDITERSVSSIEINRGSSIHMRNFHVEDHFLFPPTEPIPAIAPDSSNVTIDDMQANTQLAPILVASRSTLTVTHSTFSTADYLTSTLRIVDGNLVLDENVFLTSGPEIDGSTVAKITNSIFISNTPQGIAIGFDEHSVTISSYSEITNNTFINGRIGCYTNSFGHMHFDSNIFYNSTSIDSSAQCTYDYNLITPNVSAVGSGNTTGDPLFADTANLNFHLKPGSPAIDAADPVNPSNTHDFDGRPRPQNGRTDMGAFEYSR
jgi:hypothetical protein